MLTLEEAKTQRRCRVCEVPIAISDAPSDWPNRFKEAVHPTHVVLNYGKEFAHARCLPAAGERATLTIEFEDRALLELFVTAAKAVGLLPETATLERSIVHTAAREEIWTLTGVVQHARPPEPPLRASGQDAESCDERARKFIAATKAVPGRSRTLTVSGESGALWVAAYLFESERWSRELTVGGMRSREYFANEAELLRAVVADLTAGAESGTRL